MGLQPKYSDLILNLLVALAVSLVVNFSYVLLLIVDQKSDGQPRPAKASVIARGEEGTLRVSPDGHGYIVYENGDSVYVMMQRIYRMNLKDGDRLVANLAAPRRHGAHPVMTELRMRNGEEFDYSTLFNRPSKTTELALQLFYYLVVSFIMLSILTSVRRRYTPGRFVRHCIWCVLAAAALYMVAPVTEWRSGRIMLNCMGDHIFDYMLLLKCSFAVAVSMLYGWVYVLNSKQQAVVMENERLKNENLTTRYNMLVGQINPHFFFNSLNSLAMLVREGDEQKALTYIDQLSFSFRYIIRNGQNMLTTLAEELRFAEAYGYLFKIRYADKLFFDVDVAPKYLDYRLPVLTLQELLSNAVKHNAITKRRPLRVSIRVENGQLVVSNPLLPKLDAEPCTGIGLHNLDSRWQLITGHGIRIDRSEEIFSVCMSLLKPRTK